MARPRLAPRAAARGRDAGAGRARARRARAAPGRERGARRRHPRSRAEFERALPKAPFAAIATFRAEQRERARAVLWTETWVRTRRGPRSALFSGYWLAIGPFSAWIRRIFLREARRRAEGSGGLPRAIADRTRSSETQP